MHATYFFMLYISFLFNTNNKDTFTIHFCLILKPGVTVSYCCLTRGILCVASGRWSRKSYLHFYAEAWQSLIADHCEPDLFVPGVWYRALYACHVSCPLDFWKMMDWCFANKSQWFYSLLHFYSCSVASVIYQTIDMPVVWEAIALIMTSL